MSAIVDSCPLQGLHSRYKHALERSRRYQELGIHILSRDWQLEAEALRDQIAEFRKSVNAGLHGCGGLPERKSVKE